jgi:DNA-binding response OmpR family regulator
LSEILFVAMGGQSVTSRTALLGSAGHDVRVAVGFKDAVAILNQRRPDLLISELRLADYNGLHLVVRSQSSHPAMRTILLGAADAVLQYEASLYGALYLLEPLDAGVLLAEVERLLTKASPRRWPRKQPADALLARIEEQPGRVIDLSYGGLRFELPQDASMPSQFDVILQGTPIAFQAKPVWVRRGPSGSLSCGAELLDPSDVIVDSWRQLVDSIPTRM